MGYIFSLAFKNIIRQKRRTVLTFLVLTMGIAAYIVLIGIVEGYRKQSTENFIAFETGHLKIRSLTYDPDAPFSEDNLIKDYNNIEKILDDKKYITAFTERVNFSGEIDNGTDSTPCFIVGINPQKDSKVFSLEKYITEGKFENGAVLIGRNLAKDLEVTIGDSVFFTFRNINGMFDSVELPISGIVFADDPMVNNMTIYTDIERVKKFVNMDGITEISIVTNDYKKSKEHYADLSKDIKNYKLDTWQEMSEIIVKASKMDEISGHFFVFFILLIAVIGIVNTMLLSVYEKIREIGTLKALGMRDKDIQTLFVIEGSLIGTFGGISGVILGVIVNWYFVVYGYNIRAFGGDDMEKMMSAYRLMGVLRSSWNIQTIAGGFVICVVVSILAGFYPARKATKMQAAESLRTIQ